MGLGAQQGYYTDPQTGLVLCGHRYYDPGHGRWITRDPASYLGGSNLYGYSFGDPVDLTDPSGWISTRSTHKYPEIHIPWKTVGGIALGLAVACIPGGAEIELAGAAAEAVGAAGEIGAAAGEAGEAADAADAAGAAAKSACFVAGTPVRMADGSEQPIENVQVGDLVESRNPATGALSAEPVTRAIVKHSDAIVSLTVVSEDGGRSATIDCTPEHPFYVPGTGFVSAGSLAVGTEVTALDSSILVVVGSQLAESAHGATVYNLEVQDDHTYFVGGIGGGVWVHNDCTDIAEGLRTAGKNGDIYRVETKYRNVSRSADYREWPES